MSEDEKPAETQAVKEEVKTEPKEDYESKFKELQAEYQKSVDQLRLTQGTIDTLEQYGAINWDMITQTERTTEPETDDRRFEKLLQRQESRLLTLQFRVDNPDLKEYEDDLVVPFVLKAKQANPRKSQEEILKIASSDVRNFLSKHEKTILEKQKKAKAKEDLENMSGLETKGHATPDTELDEATANQKYVEFRRQKRAKQIGMS